MGLPVQTAMIIDDDVDLTNILGRMLEKRKMQVMKIHSLEEAGRASVPAGRSGSQPISPCRCAGPPPGGHCR